ncbi:serine palmitoyltransferase component [Borealophlyctis nickersoniae]|nr:serine palmitoyltransferase component [Borealophlyctis nickersoniae]
MDTALGSLTTSPLVTEAAKEIADTIALALNTTFTLADHVSTFVPGSKLVFRYIRASHQNDPYRTLLEILLVVFMFWYFGGRRHKPGEHRLELTEKEVQELIDEWEPEPLVPSLTEFQKVELEKVPVITGPSGPKPKTADGKERLNLASYNFLGIMNQEIIKEKAVQALRKYGVGSCGPPGFYGTLDVHMDLERELARFVGTEMAIIYSQAFSTIASVIPAFSKRGDLLIVDDGVSFATQKGVQISRSNVKYFKHNDLEDLERVLKQVQADDIKNKKKTLTRRFIVVEGLYVDYGDICPLPELVELKEKYKYRLIVEESCSFGVLGKRGAGVADHFGLPPTSIDIMVGSMSNALSSAGGFCAGTTEIVDHQRLSGAAYTFSASLPAMLAVAASEAINILEKTPDLLHRLRQNATVMRATLAKNLHPDAVIHPAGGDTPIIHIRLRHRSEAGREDEEKVLQDIVDEAARGGVLVARAKYVVDQERNPPPPSIRVLATAAHTKKEAEKAAGVVRDAVRKVLKARK